ncbi:MAG: protein phosphatase 2C domain-containing protein [Candidatus Limnocylindria bacterium]
MRLRIGRTSLAKAGNRRDENEDAIAFSLARRRFAVSDGATASSFSREWSSAIASWYVHGKSDGSIAAGIKPIQHRWAQALEGRDWPWYVAEKALQGAFATLVGLTIRSDRTWEAVAVGDSCLFQTRDGRTTSFPLSKAEEFSSRPLLIGSRAEWNDKLDRWTRRASGTIRAGDELILATDAIAALLVARTVEDDEIPAVTLHLHGSSAERRARLSALRRSGALKNDDLSLLHIRVE